MSGPRRLIRLARASVAVLRYKGPLDLAKHVALWVRGKRGYYLRDIRERLDLGMDFHEWFMLHRASAAELAAQRQRGAQFALRPLVSFIVPVYDPAPSVLAETIESVLAQTYEQW
ncbi:MAG: hypothetical protein ACRDHE_08050, partial [Ktedonobacterales bacterium]